jgi:GMP synthase (glutamine-hydrolysing)
MMARLEPIVVVDFGSQYTQLILRRIRALSVSCVAVPCTAKAADVKALAPRGVILSGSPASVYEPDAPRLAPELLDLPVPVLGICYGLQCMAAGQGGAVEPGERREFGRARLVVRREDPLFSGLPARSVVWMSHGDRVTRLPQGWVALASSAGSPYAAVRHASRDWWGVQFHPEVAHTPGGERILENFAVGICGAPRSWKPASFVARAVAGIRETVGGGGRVLAALSGGVDSSVTAALVQEAIGDRLTCVLVDNGLLRKGEADEVRRAFGERLGANLRCVDAAGEFLSALAGIEDPEAKRKTIGRTFIEVFEREARRIGKCEFLAQGTLYPDVIESISHRGPSATIKSHHNVGGLPERMRLALVEPLKELFKDEVRAVGAELGLPRELLGRHPFPGPGLAIRVLGPVTREALALVAEADAIFIEELRASGWYDKVWQAFTVLLPVRAVGVMGDARTYENVLALRAVDSVDGMTADWSRLPARLVAKVAGRIIDSVRGINRVVYDVSSKPPATIEWE